METTAQGSSPRPTINHCLKTYITPNPDPPPALDTNRPVSQSTTQNQWAQDRIRTLNQQGVEELRVNQQQVNAQGQRVGINRPDLQYTGEDGVRVCEEVDTSSSTRGPGHADRILANDPDAVVYLWDDVD